MCVAAARGCCGAVWQRRGSCKHPSPHPRPPLQVSTTYISCPADAGETLGIKMPYLVMIVKNLRKYFSFEVQASWSTAVLRCSSPADARATQVIDDKGIKRRFRASNFQARGFS